MSAATFPGSALLPALSPSSNLVVSYCLISSVNRTAWLRGLCKAQPSCKSLQEAEASFLSRCSSVCATSALPISSLFSRLYGIFPPNLFWVCHIHRFGAPAFLTVFANIKMTLKVTEFVEHHLTSILRAEEEIAALFLITWRSLMDSSLLDWKKVYIYNKTLLDLGASRSCLGREWLYPSPRHQLSKPEFRLIQI